MDIEIPKEEAIQVAREINRMAQRPEFRGNKCMAGAYMTLGVGCAAYTEGTSRGRGQGFAVGLILGGLIAAGTYKLGKALGKKSEKSGK